MLTGIRRSFINEFSEKGPQILGSWCGGFGMDNGLGGLALGRDGWIETVVAGFGCSVWVGILLARGGRGGGGGGWIGGG